MQVLVDSYSQTNKNTDYSAGSGNRQEVAQSFTSTNNYILENCQFYLAKQQTPTGSIYAKVYTEKHAIAYGVDSLPDVLLATSDHLDVSTLSADPTYTLKTFTFSGINRVQLSAGEHYVVSCAYAGDGNNNHLVNVGIDTTSPTAYGNLSEIVATWTAHAYDTCFYVYGSALFSGINAKKDENDVSTVLGTLVTDGKTIVPITVNPTTGGISALDGKSGSIAIASYSESNYNHDQALGSASKTQAGQTFRTGNAIYLNNCKFFMRRVGSPTGSAYAVLYNMTGTYGTNGKPIGAPLAISEPFDVSTLPASPAARELETFYFYGSNRIPLQPSANYCIDCKYTGGDASNYIVIGYDTIYLTAPGNFNSLSLDGKTWTGISTADTIFYISGGLSGNAERDENDVPAIMGVSSIDGVTPVPIAADSNGNLLIDST